MPESRWSAMGYFTHVIFAFRRDGWPVMSDDAKPRGGYAAIRG